MITAGFMALLSFSTFIPSVNAQLTDKPGVQFFADILKSNLENFDLFTPGDFDFEEYRAVISIMAESEEFPHFLAENAERYDAYQELNPNMPFDVVIAHVNVSIDKEFYVDVQPVPNPDSITVLVNKIFEMPEDWEPGDFVDLGGGHLMRVDAAEHFNKMRDVMREAGLNLNIIITYRSYSRQRSHFNNGVARVGMASALLGFAKAGHSEHQTGLAIDVLQKAHDGGLMMDHGFENSRQYTWLLENAHEYGFILRFPRNQRDASGFTYEPWHWRYVGVPIATAMHDESIILYEEFYGRYLVQGVFDKVNAYILEQKALAEAPEAAAIAEAEAAAAQAAALAEEERAAAEAAEQTAILEAAIKAEEERAAAELAAAIAAEKAEEEARIREATSANRHFLELFATAGISIAVTGLVLVRKIKSSR